MSEEEKAELEELYENSEWWHNRFNAVQRDYEELKNKIDKAIEYIKTQVHRNQQFYEMDKDNLLEILGDKENDIEFDVLKALNTDLDDDIEMG